MSHNAASVFPAQSRWYLVIVDVPAGKAVPIDDSFFRLVFSKLPLKCSVPLQLEDAGRLESFL